jgi:hypothetical protein
MSGTQLTDAVTANLSKLEVLDVACCNRFSGMGLSQLPALTSLVCVGNLAISDAQVAALVTCVNGGPSHLDLRGCLRLSHAGLLPLLLALPRRVKVVEIYLLEHQPNISSAFRRRFKDVFEALWDTDLPGNPQPCTTEFNFFRQGSQDRDQFL